MPIYKSRGKQDNRQGQRIQTVRKYYGYARDQYGHRLYSVQGRGGRATRDMNGNTVYVDGIERFKGTRKACIEFCRARYGRDYIIVPLVRG